MIAIPLTLTDALASARETRELEIGSNILVKTVDVFRRQFPNRRAVVVADKNTFRVAGREVAEAFAKNGIPCEPPFVFTAPDLYAEFRFVEELEQSLKAHSAIPVAVGSGVINDLAKLAAYRTGRYYLCVATAASMDGYTAFGASVTYKGAKQTFTCPAPVAVVADVEVIRGAPPEMTASGYADLLAKITAGADWILADALGAESIDLQSWNIVQGRLRECLTNPKGARSGDTAAIFGLTEGLMLGGFAMQSSKSSRPASGAEHQFSHLWDMQHHTHNGVAPSHGFKVGVATLAVTALYEQIFQAPIERLDVSSCVATWPVETSLEKTVRTVFAGDEFLDKIWEETRAKYVSREQLTKQLNHLRSAWPDIKSKLQRQLIPFTEAKQMLDDVGAPTEPEQIGISRERLRNSFVLAYYLRRRFTILDVAVRTGLLESSLASIFGPKGRWPIAKNQIAA